jgi:hypothetical protein
MPFRFSRLRNPVFAGLFLGLLLSFGGSGPVLASRNLLPRLPELVIEKGFSGSFSVTACDAQAEVTGEEVSCRVRISLKNIGETPIDSSIKVRVLYPLSEHAVQLEVNGKPFRYSRKNPRLPLNLAPGEETTFVLKTRQGINYNLDALKKEDIEEPEGKDGKKKKLINFGIGELTKLFERESFGRRFMIGPMVSKWGIFPVQFEQVSIQIDVPRDFAGVIAVPTGWQDQMRNNSRRFTFSGTEEFAGAVFLPQGEVDAFRKMQAESAAVPTSPNMTPID